MRDPIIVVADDLTGAAELAGIGLRHGLRVELVPDARALAAMPEVPLVVINTDSRGLSPTDAAARVAAIARGVSGDVYKKVDSVLRGPVLAEIEAMLAAMPRFRRSLVVAQNPSRGRTIDAAGTYRIDGVPLDQTAFARDPDHPRRTASAVALLGASDRVTIGVATSLAEVRHFAATLDDDVLPVGGADFFEAILERLYAGSERTRAAPAPDARAGPARVRSDPAYSAPLASRILFVCGSADATTHASLVARVSPAVELPDAWFVGEAPSARAIVDWALPLRRQRVAALLAPVPRCDPARVHALLCDAAAALIEAPLALYVDGGATAIALCRRMKWATLDVVAEVGPGAVTLAPAAGIELTIKPGSYTWPASVWANADL